MVALLQLGIKMGNCLTVIILFTDVLAGLLEGVVEKHKNALTATPPPSPTHSHSQSPSRSGLSSSPIPIG